MTRRCTGLPRLALWLALAGACAGAPAQTPTPPPTSLQRSAEAGDVDAMLRLADAYRDGGQGQARNPALALQWYLKAAERDNVSAMTEAAYGHLQGWGGQRNEVEAARWYRRAADKGDAVGASWLGEFHRHGWGGLAKDPAEMLRWLRMAAQRGNTGAMRDLGAAYEQGQGVAADRAQALRWYEQAAVAGAEAAADITRLGGRPATTAQGGSAASAAAPTIAASAATKPPSLAGVYVCRVSGDVDQINGFGESTPSFAEAELKVTVAEDLSARFTLTRPPHRGTFERAGRDYRWADDVTTDSGNERQRTLIDFSARDLTASGTRHVRTFWRSFGGRQVQGSWAYKWTWNGRCRRETKE